MTKQRLTMKILKQLRKFTAGRIIGYVTVSMLRILIMKASKVGCGLVLLCLLITKITVPQFKTHLIIKERDL